jgi:Protein of unknown function (DUF3606)
VNTTLNQEKHGHSNALMTRRESVTTVNFAGDDELSYWTQQLNCSSEKLLAAVESVGPRVEHVTEYLRAGW